MEDYIVVFATVPSRDEAKMIAKALLEEKLCACVNVVPGVDSFFQWEAKIDNAQEFLLVIKTKFALYGELESFIKSKHSYTVPEIIAIPIVAGSKDYMAWIEKSVK